MELSQNRTFNAKYNANECLRYVFQEMWKTLWQHRDNINESFNDHEVAQLANYYAARASNRFFFCSLLIKQLPKYLPIDFIFRMCRNNTTSKKSVFKFQTQWRIGIGMYVEKNLNTLITIFSHYFFLKTCLRHFHFSRIILLN